MVATILVNDQASWGSYEAGSGKKKDVLGADELLPSRTEALNQGVTAKGRPPRTLMDAEADRILLRANMMTVKLVVFETKQSLFFSLLLEKNRVQQYP
jgi:hypothetical protein